MDELSILVVEDDDTYYFLLSQLLEDISRQKFKCRITRAARLKESLAFLAAERFDIVLTDLGLDDSQGLGTFLSQKEHAPKTPFIILSGMNDEDIALTAVKRGAQDYLSKMELSRSILFKSIQYGIERNKLLLELEASLHEIKTLRGLLPVCAGCKKIRDDQGAWTNMEDYICERSSVEFSHGLCPDCFQKHYPHIYEQTQLKKQQ